jgi:hypothetical protein
MERIGVERMIKPKPMFWILLMGIAIWYFLIMYPITTLITIVGGSVTIGLLLKYTDERDLNE